ncbi:DNA-binding transcriptional LysR family regulator [Kitasatospora sp. MAA19]|uniref:LysR family transcriptional regulator n=1 Tax=unclassified Kitasatospora TaxID=2633591 RepID=UPI00247678D7|nr:LysR family transcriptional regulator [Kitasatospora sp. MAA19]MDH6707819.1 DNA-binding transcriptional LysR family regulator [Kitasatospora sp. MAA19]
MDRTTPGPVLPELPLQELECFSVLVHQLHFGRTAELLGVSQGRVSQLIKRLESRVGAPVFRRTSRRVELTELGRALAEQVVPAFDRLRAGYEAARARAASTHRPLRLGFQCAVYEPVARAIAGLPEGAAHLVELSWGDPFSHLGRGEIDLAIVLSPCREEGLRVLLEFSRQPMYVALSAAHRLAGAPSVAGDELAALALIEPRGPAPDYWRRANAPRRTRDGRELAYQAGAATVQEGLSTVASTRRGLLLCEASTAYVQRPDIRYLPVPDLEPSTLLVVESERSSHPLADRFVELLAGSVR